MSDARLRAHAEVLRDALEAMLLRLDVRGGNPRASEAIRATVRALSTFADLELDDPGTLTSIEDARAGLDALRASGAPDEDEILEEAEAWVKDLRSEIADRIASVPALRADVAAGAPFIASVGAPSLFVGVEVALPHAIPVDDRWKDFEEGAAKSPRARTVRAAPATEQAQIDLLARDLMEDLATLGSLRRTSGLEMWSEAEGFEKRLLASLDALVSLALPVRSGVARLDLARALFTYATEWWVPDGGRSFAFALALSCLASETAMRWVVLGAQRAPEAALHAFEAGLSLGSSPAVASAILALAATESPPLVKVALGVARRRRYFHASLLPLVLHPDRSISMAALRMIALAPRATAVEAASGVLTHDAPGRTAVTAVACEVLAMLGDPRGVALARDLLGRALAEEDLEATETALRIVALAGDRRDADLVQRAALAVPGGLILLAYFGAPEHALVIAEQLRTPERVEEAEHALLRLTAIRFEPPFDVDATKRTATEKLREQSGRVRHGAPHSLAVVLDELRSPTTRQRDREVLRVEASMMAREPLGVDLDGWVSRQRADLDALARVIGPKR